MYLINVYVGGISLFDFANFRQNVPFPGYESFICEFWPRSETIFDPKNKITSFLGIFYTVGILQVLLCDIAYVNFGSPLFEFKCGSPISSSYSNSEFTFNFNRNLIDSILICNVSWWDLCFSKTQTLSYLLFQYWPWEFKNKLEVKFRLGVCLFK